MISATFNLGFREGSSPLCDALRPVRQHNMAAVFAQASAASRIASPRASARAQRRAHASTPRQCRRVSPALTNARGELTRMRAEFAEIDADAETAPGGVAEGRFGPDAILLAGFDADGTNQWRKQLDDAGADMVRLVTATADMMTGTLGEALETVQADAAAVETAPDIPRMMFFSGMVGGEIMQLVDLWSQMDVGGCIFACAVPNNWDGRLDELCVEIADDHEMMMEREAAGVGVPETEEFTEYKAESVQNRA